MKTIPLHATLPFQKIQSATLETLMPTSLFLMAPHLRLPIVMVTTQNSEPLHVFRVGYIPGGGY